MKHILLIGAAIAAMTAQAEAGNLTAVDGTASWKSTQCAVPVRPANLPGDAEEDANVLNEHVVLYNQYTARVKAYMECVRREAEADIANAQHAAVTEAQRAIQFAREENDKVRAQLQKDQKPK